MSALSEGEKERFVRPESCEDCEERERKLGFSVGETQDGDY